MNIIDKFRFNRTVKNAVQEQQQGYSNYSNTGGLYTRDIMKYLHMGNESGKYDNFYGDYNRIITNAPTFPLYYVDKRGDIDEKSNVAQYIAEPNDSFPQYKVLQQMYSEMITKGYSDIFLWRKDGKNETQVFEEGKTYKEDLFRGFTLVAGYDYGKLSKAQKDSIVRIQYGVSQANVFMGHSPSQAAESWRSMQDSMGLHMTAFARNAGIPLGQWVIIAPNIEEYVKIKDGLEKKISGARNNGKQLFSWQPAGTGETQIKWVQFTSQDVQDYTAQLEFAEKKMSQSFGVPGTIKGTNDGEAYASARVSEQVFIKYTIAPLIEDLRSQLQHVIKQRFAIEGEIKCNVVIPEVADESLIKIRATESQVELFDRKIAEGYTAESIVMAYDLPERFLLLEKETDAESSQNTPKKAKNSVKSTHKHDLVRKYQNTLTEAEKNELEQGFRTITDEYADKVLENGVVESARTEYVGKMEVVFSTNYSKLYDKALDDVADSLLDILEIVDVSDLNLTEEELAYAAAEYRRRVDDFSKTFSQDVADLPGETLTVRKAAAKPNIDRVVVTESEHTRIVSELQSWTKAQEEFPVRVTKKWNAQDTACDECRELEDTEIDVTALFINNPNVSEIYEVQGGGLHPNCRCFVTYTMEGEDVRRFENN